jgi:hypothetical protein
VRKRGRCCEKTGSLLRWRKQEITEPKLVEMKRFGATIEEMTKALL